MANQELRTTKREEILRRNQDRGVSGGTTIRQICIRTEELVTALEDLAQIMTDNVEQWDNVVAHAARDQNQPGRAH